MSLSVFFLSLSVCMYLSLLFSLSLRLLLCDNFLCLRIRSPHSLSYPLAPFTPLSVSMSLSFSFFLCVSLLAYSSLYLTISLLLCLTVHRSISAWLPLSLYVCVCVFVCLSENCLITFLVTSDGLSHRRASHACTYWKANRHIDGRMDR